MIVVREASEDPVGRDVTLPIHQRHQVDRLLRFTAGHFYVWDRMSSQV